MSVPGKKRFAADRRAGLAAAEPDQPEGSRKWWKIAPRDSPMVCSSRRTVALS
jgi:hypothetical protein